MRALLTPYIQPDLGLVVLKPGKELLPLLSYGRLLLSNEPAEFKSLPSGPLPDTDQLLVADPRWTSFFQNERVIKLAGGVSSLEVQLKRGLGCQWQGSDGYHDTNIITCRYGVGVIRLCWHHDNKITNHADCNQRLLAVAATNVAEFITDAVRRHFLFPEGHQLTWPELCCWAILHDVADLLPSDIARSALRMPPEPEIKGGMTESSITWTPGATEIIEKKTAAVLSLIADEAPPKSYMLRPKHTPWRSEKYTRWVKSQPCVCCGQQADDPHHIIGHGQGGTGTKTHDIFTIPLCRQHHTELHLDMVAWESEYGSQIDLLFKFLDRAFGLGALS